MITTTQQYNLVCEQLDKLNARLVAGVKKGVPSTIANMSAEQIRESIKELEKRLSEYQNAKDADINNLSFSSYAEMLKLPMIIRVSKGLSVRVFSEILEISESQVKRYEIDEHSSAPASVFDKLFNKFGIGFQANTIRRREEYHPNNGED